MYFFVIQNFLNPIGLTMPVWSLGAGVLMNACISLIVKSFFLMRIWKLSGNLCITVICLHSLLEYDGSASGARIEGYASLALEVATDVMISAALIYSMWRGRSGLRQSDDMIARLILVTIATGGLTTLIAIADLASYIVAPTTLYVLLFNMMLGKGEPV
ncbi:hypothetical protein BD311DRAFT_740687 [Dichomitus squalens]|uniref:DUF6534 domain-containing protein n=1 Tax=Dichomitus squalens TaxID=114155 RepID=A0A4Q9MK09_9APHY|nr:hypothetical protein BD311DRAFT_740687 [Dichomitus squalens]